MLYNANRRSLFTLMTSLNFPMVAPPKTAECVSEPQSQAMESLGLSQRAGRAENQPISELMSQALANPNLISLAAGFVDQQTLPVEPTRAALDRMMSNPLEARAALQYGTTPGYRPLRERLIAEFASSLGNHAPPTIEQTLLTAGSNQLLHLVAESLLDPGDVVLCASPTYLVFLGTLNNLGAVSMGVATDDDGMIPEALEETLRKLDQRGELSRVKAIYLVPYYDNPRGVSTPLDRRAEIVQLAKKWSFRQKIHVIEDAAYRSLRYEGDDIPSAWTVDEEHDTLIVAGTFSKSYSPGLRIGWGFIPQHLIDPVCHQKGNIDFGSPNFNQHLLHHVFELGLYEPHVQHIRNAYSEKLHAMLDAADEFLGPLEEVQWTRPQGGLYVWVTLPDGLSSGPSGGLFEAAVEEGVLYVPGQYSFCNQGEAVKENTIRLSFGVQDCENIRLGVKALASAITKTRISSTV